MSHTPMSLGHGHVLVLRCHSLHCVLKQPPATEPACESYVMMIVSMLLIAHTGVVSKLPCCQPVLVHIQIFAIRHLPGLWLPRYQSHILEASCAELTLGTALHGPIIILVI